MAVTLKGSMATPSPFDTVAETYDEVFSASAIGRAQRDAVWSEMDRVFAGGQRILEINCGTGIDAIHMARRSVHVEACDSSSRMIASAQRRADAERVPVEFRCLPIERLDELIPAAPYDGILSNFSGLNCVADLDAIAGTLSRLVRPGGRVVLCIFVTFCLWEVAWYLSNANLSKAFRRFRRNGTKAVLAPSTSVTVYYRTVTCVRNKLAPHFRLERRHGVGILVPPSYAACVVSKFPRLFRAAVLADRFICRWPVIRSMADHTVLTFERIEEDCA